MYITDIMSAVRRAYGFMRSLRTLGRGFGVDVSARCRWNAS